MITIIPTEMGLVLDSMYPIDQVTINKLTNPVNANRIKAHLKDIDAQQDVKTSDTQTEHHLKVTLYKEMSASDFKRCIKKFDADHLEFLENVDRMAEVESSTKPTNTDENLVEVTRMEQLEFVKELSEAINKDEILGCDIMGSELFLDTFPLPWGKMSCDLLKEMCELYLEKYEHKNK